MNNLIKELMAQATYDVLGVKQIDQQLFAELIIKECLDICEKGTETQTTSQGAAILIRQRFGIE